MILTREKGTRMWGGGTGIGSGGSSAGGGGVEGGVSPLYVEENYVSKEFFNQIFAVRVTTTVSVVDDQGEPVGEPTVTTSVVTPNTIPASSVDVDEDTGYVTTTTVVIESVQVLGGVWTNSYVSALGQNPAGSGGGGGGSSTLAGLTDVAIDSPEDGQILMYDGLTQKWINGAGGSVSLNEPLSSINNEELGLPPNTNYNYILRFNNSTHHWEYDIYNISVSIRLMMPTGFNVTGSPSGRQGAFTVTMAEGYQIPLTADINKGVTSYGWGDHAAAGYATQQWVGQQGYLTSVDFSDITSHPTTLSGYGITDALSSGTTFWGQQVANGVVTGNMSSVGNITMNGIIFNDGNYLLFKSSVNAVGLMIEGGMTESGVTRATFGFHPAQSSNVTAWWNDKILLQLKQSSSEAYVDIPNGILQIGEARLIWDAANGAIKVQRSDGTAANFYATGGVSALGMSASGSSGGGIILNEPLASINNAGLSAHPSSSGMTVVWNGSTWVYGTAGGSSSTAWTDITGKPTTISGYGITDAKIQNGTITLGSNSITPLTSTDISDMATMTWVGQQGYTSNLGTVISITAGTGLSGGTITNSGTISISSDYRGYIAHGETAYGWGNHANAGYLTGIDSVMVTSALGYTPVSNTVTFWGQTINGGVVSGAMTGVGSLTATGVIKTSSANAFRLTYGTASVPGVILRSDETMFYMLFTNPGQQDTGAYNNLRPLYINKTTGLVRMDEGLYLEGSFTSATSYKGLRIGDGLITWDSTNQALKVEQIKKVNNVDTMVAGSIYATGSVSALGFGTNQAGSITIADLTVNTLMVTDTDFMLSKQKIGTGNSAKNYLSVTGKDGVLINYNENNSFNARFWTMNPAQNVYYSCLDIKYLYLANNVFLYYEDNNVKLSINGNTYTLIKS